jgi:stress response protein YsnF
VIEAVPDVRWEGDTFIVPVVEEVLVVEKRLVLKEELHIRPEKSVERVEKPVVVRRTVATVERSGPRGDGN